MKHPCLFKSTQEHDYTMPWHIAQMPIIVDVPSDNIKTN